MGLSPFKKSCYTNSSVKSIPNPDPSRFVVKAIHTYKKGFILEVTYLDCINFEGNKVMVYEGSIPTELPKKIDPHFSRYGFSPVARFPPTERGKELARILVEAL